MHESISNLGATTASGASFKDVLALLHRSRLRVHRMSRAQYLASKRAGRMHVALGVPTVVLSAAVGTSIFASFSVANNAVWLTTTGVISILSTVFAAIQGFFRYAEYAESHRTAGATYANLKRELDILAVRIELCETSPIEGLDSLAAIVARIDEVQTTSLDVADKLYDRARKEQEDDSEGI